MTIQNKTLLDPTLYDVLLNFKNDIFRNFHCIKIGKINKFDSTKKTAEIQILFKRIMPNESIKSYPLLIDCPIITLQGNKGFLQMPIQQGDNCLVFFADRNIDSWFVNGSETAPFDSRTHSLSDGIALVGLNALTSTLPAYESNTVKLKNDAIYISEKNNKANIQNASTSLLDVLQGLIQGIQGATAGGNPIVDTTGKIGIALTNLTSLLYKD